jgi:sulfatase maturation enzyme AslB (radical SAM superfamily)
MELTLQNLNDHIGKESPVYIYGFGLAGRWLSTQLPGRVRGFIDTDLKKKGMSMGDICVMTIKDAMDSMPVEAVIIVSVIDIQDVLDIVRTLPHTRWVALGLYLESGKSSALDGFPESSEFIDYSLSAVEQFHKAYFDHDKLFLRSVDVMITERCTLKCRDCSNLMQYYEEPKNISLNQVLDDFNSLANNVDHIFEVRLIGGEPFMNKDIYEIIDVLVKSTKISRLVIFSNAMVPFKLDKIRTLRHPKIVLSLTNYGNLAKKTMDNVSLLDGEGIPYRLHPPENWTDSGVIFDFERSVVENEQLFENCCGKNLLTLSLGKLYRCPFAANADRLGAIPADPKNAVQASEGKNAIKTYTRDISYLPACNYCKGRSFDAPQIEPALQTEKPLPYRRFALIPD